MPNKMGEIQNVSESKLLNRRRPSGRVSARRLSGFKPTRLIRHVAGRIWSASSGLTLVALLCVTDAARAQNATPINPPAGTNINLTASDFVSASTFSSNDRLVATDYFYWYDVYSGAHIRNGDGTDALTDHPPTLTDFSYLSVAWHKTQFTDMIAAGIDVALPVSWGAPSERDPVTGANHWSFAALPPMVAAREQLLQAGQNPPRLGMFYDTSTLRYNSWSQAIDLTTPYGREWFYETIRDFFSLIPPRHWAMIDGHPLVFLYSSSFALNYDQRFIDFTKQSFARDFGGRTPYIVREISWQVQADNVYAWGGSLGLKNPGVASLGPGYNDSAVPGRKTLIVDREGGGLFERNWIRFLRNPSTIVVAETWNEYHEATDIAASREYGRAYIDLNRQYADMFKQGIRPPLPPGPYTDVKFVSVSLQATNLEEGLRQFDLADGVTYATNVTGVPARALAPSGTSQYFYFRIDDSFKWAASMHVEAEVDYYDAVPGSFTIQFDGSDPNAPFQGAYSSSTVTVSLAGDKRWKTATLPLFGAKFLNSENGGADFRIAASAMQLLVGRVKVSRPGLPAEAGQTVTGYQDDFSGGPGANWQASQSETGAFQWTGGTLAVHSSPGRREFLLLNLPELNGSAQEVLARARVRGVSTNDNAPGGVALGVATNDATGFNLYFTTRNPQGRSLPLDNPRLPAPPASSFGWKTNVWYWLRLRQQTNALAGIADVFSKAWPADGITPEPAAWLSAWDYFPASAAQSGWPGIMAGADDGGSVMEFDYFLVQSPALPIITARLPALKPARAALRVEPADTQNDLHLSITGEPAGYYELETSTNLTDWLGISSLVLTNGAAQWQDSGLAGSAARYYRVRFMP